MRLVSRLGWPILATMALVAVLQVSSPAPAGASSSAAADPGGIGVRLLDAPADAGKDPRAQLYIVDHLSPGSTISRRIEVTNTTREPATVSLYAAGATIGDGQFLGAAGRTGNDLSAWSSVLPATVDLPAGGSAPVTVTITVPADAAGGERYAVVWAEVRTGAKTGIVQVNRVGIRLYVSVGSGAPPAADFEIESLTALRSPDGFPTVVATVRNTGSRALDMSGSLELLNGPGGLRAGPFLATLGSTLAVGGSGQVTIALDERVPDGPWDAELTLRSGLLERNAKQAITFPGSASPVPATTEMAGWLLPASGLVFALLGALVVIALLTRRRRAAGTST